MTYVWRCINSLSRILVNYVTMWNEFNQCITDAAVTKCSNIHLQRHFKPRQWPSVFWLRLHKIPRHYINTVLMNDWVVVLRPTRHKIGHFGDVPQANLLAWYGNTKPETTRAHIHQSKEYKKNIARFSRLLRHLTWKWRGPILVLALRKFVTYLLT